MKYLTRVLLIFALLFTVCFASCGQTDKDKDEAIRDVYRLYAEYTADRGGSPLTYEKWLASIKGEKGEKGLQGLTGNGIKSIEKVASSENKDTYRFTFTDGTFYEFTLTNGKDGTDGQNGLDGKNGENGKDGTDGQNIELRLDGESGYVQWKYSNSDMWVNLISIKDLKAKDGRDGLDGTPGKDGLTPYIGENGHWWIGDLDTDVPADYSKEDKRDLTTWQKIVMGAIELTYETKTINNGCGYVVTGFTLHMEQTYEDYQRVCDFISYDEYIEIAKEVKNGKRTIDVVIPNYVGHVPVIGVESDAFRQSENIRSVSLSKNTVFLGARCFENCKNLEAVDFNDCPLRSIPRYCFANTRLTEVRLPATVRNLFSYAFSKCKIKNINYENIEYYGTYCLDSLAMDYVYLKKNVKTVDDYAFSLLFLYAEPEVAPEQWSSRPSATHNEYIGIRYGVKQSGEYLYSANATGISVNRYLGKEKKLSVPATIEGHIVTAIGYGFASFSDARISGNEQFFTYQGALQEKKHDEIVIPNTVTKIETGALITGGTMIYIPDSVSDMWYYTGLMEDEFPSSYLAFQGNTFPENIFSHNAYEGSEQDKKSNYISMTKNNAVRYSFGNEYTQMIYDESEKTYYCFSDGTYALMAVMAGCDSTLALTTGTYNGLPVTTILPYAVANLHEIEIIKITGNYKRIRPNAFCHLPFCKAVFVGNGVEIINANAFSDCGEKYFIESEEKPDDWDTVWCDKSRDCITGAKDFGEKNGFVYYVDSSARAVLYKHIKDINLETLICIPSTIDGYAVYKVSSNCFYIDTRDGIGSQSRFLFYVPSSVEYMEEKAICFSSYSVAFCTVYTDLAVLPDTWHTNWMCTASYSYSYCISYGYFKLVFNSSKETASAA